MSINALITGDGRLARELASNFSTSTMVPNTVMDGPEFIIYCAIQDALEELGQFDVVINCYGVNHLSWIGTTDMSDAEWIFRANCILPYGVINHLIKIGQGPCRIVNIASQTHKVPQRCTSLYCASKAALVMMTKVMARELGPKGWIVNAVAPGKIVETEMTEKTDAQILDLRGWTAEEADRYAISNIPAGRFTTVTEVSEAVLKLLEMPTYVNGICLDVTGGV